jgi:hypothetical protein
VAVRALCKNEMILDIVQTVIDNGGEGLILQKYGSAYDVGRSESLVKLKVHPPPFLLIFLFVFYFSMDTEMKCRLRKEIRKESLFEWKA